MKKEKIKIKDEVYEIDHIEYVTPHVLQIIFSGDIPIEWGDISIFTVGEIEVGKIVGYETVYRIDGEKVYLSNDGSIYIPPEETDPPDNPIDSYEPTLDEIKEDKRKEVSRACESTIYGGFSILLQDGMSVEHFSLTEHDQINLFGKQAQLSTGMQELEYHADGQPCRYYSAADMQAIIAAALWHVSYHTTYCNAINMWIAACETAEDVQAIYYGADVPEEYQSEVLKAYLARIMEEAGGEKGDANSETET